MNYRALLTERPDYVTCRTLGHSWDYLPITPDVGSTATRTGVWLRLRCVRCTTERLDEVSRTTGYVEGRRYVYPDGYHRDMEHSAARDDWRAAYLRIVGAVRDRTRAETNGKANNNDRVVA